MCVEERFQDESESETNQTIITTASRSLDGSTDYRCFTFWN